jgi:polyhydroxybutyrate depolymerase
LCLLLAGLAATQAVAEQSRRVLNHDGLSRAYNLYVPSSYDGGEALPLLLLLHGRSGNGQRMADLTSFNARAEEHGFLVAYPDSLNGAWNYLQGIPGAQAMPDDVGFLREVAAAVAIHYNVDPGRLYVAGISMGGFMAQRLACDAQNPFAAFASVAAGGYAAMPGSCANPDPVDALFVHGTADTAVPWQGLGVEDETGNRQRVTLSIANSVRFWVEHNRCASDADAYDLPPAGNSPGTRVKVVSSQGCAGDSSVVLYAVIGGGHNWPGSEGVIPPSVAGAVNLDIHASDVIWAFFDGR